MGFIVSFSHDPGNEIDLGLNGPYGSSLAGDA